MLAGSASLLALSAGCLDDGFDDASGPGTGDENSDDEETADDDGSADSDASSTDDLVEETHTYQQPDVPESPNATVLRDEGDADAWLEERWDVGEPDDDLVAFVEETAFEDALLVALEAEGSNLCYEMGLEDAELDDETLTLEAEVSDESDADEVCAEQVTAAGLLARVPFASGVAPSTEFVAEIVDADGTTHERRADADGESDE
ncbi:hypothetical protein C490_03893 [Natronobacterium gregoryi SP2]|uniref:Uncharacterized protein n=1 Tax=Natronobacterium gregoryi (strain ATCC 43098 / DSM 3393 / CCM 3738 / CIP 104747 / IAM 13177 / JCM 8860 / NBRC 102187 / NCIMB 2189 / SP2) TaxID=797304 RepID=L9YFJ2_NATGS|nr:hypothetical protein C490_03893 [Natronobacterium gregoryi SP2]